MGHEGTRAQRSRTGVPAADLLLDSARTLRASWRGRLEDVGLTPHEARALRVVAQGVVAEGAATQACDARSGEPARASASPSPRLADIAAALRIAPRSATEVVDRLQARGLVERRPSPVDRRAIEVVVTAEGERFAAAVENAWHEAAQEFLAPLRAAQRDELSALLRTLVSG